MIYPIRWIRRKIFQKRCGSCQRRYMFVHKVCKPKYHKAVRETPPSDREAVG